MSYSHLPEAFKFSHDFCFFLHDQMVFTLKSGEEANIFSHSWEMDPNNSPIPDGMSGEELVQWLEQKGHKDVIYILYYKQICAALLADMLHFIYEALSCSAKGKLTVTYALLRKPIKENLFYLEWLLADPSDMLAKFDSDDLRSRSISRSFTEERKKEIIKAALSNTEYRNWIDPDFIYDLRYNKSFSLGFESLFQKANHLVTTFRFMETERSNFNFVFSDEQSWESQWDGLYSFLPVLLFHAVQIVDTLIANFAQRKQGVDLTALRTIIGMVFWLERGPHSSKLDHLRKDLRDKLHEFELTCPDCKSELIFDDAHMLLLYQENSMKCGTCKWSTNLGTLTGDF